MDRRNFQKELLKSDFNRVVCIASIEDDLEVLNTISAFSNTSGGTIFLGVNTKCKVIGVNPISIIEELNFTISRLNKEPFFAYQIKQLDHYQVLEITIHKSEDLIAVDEVMKCYFRLNAENCRFGKVIERYWMLSDEHLVKDREGVDELLEFISSQNAVTLTSVYKSVYLPKVEIEAIMVDLLWSKIIDFTIDTGTVLFQRLEN